MNVKITFILSFLFLFFVLEVSAQKENNNWYFGKHVGITFNNGSPVALPPSAMVAYEGTISVSDSAGNLLFYSSGDTIWNRNHVPMKNGTGLKGHKSATQSVLAVPKPGSQTIYYIFTVDAIEDSLQNGLRYSILDMRLESGLGAITNTKNVFLDGPITEKLTAVRHANNDDFWILAHKWNSREFIAHKLSCEGLSNEAVISSSGSIHGGNIENLAGQLKANKQSTKLALTNFASRVFELFDFDAATGIVSNAQSSDSIFWNPYGVEFSDDGTKLYGTVEQPIGLVQFDLNASPSLDSFISIPVDHNPIGNNRLWGLQIGPDNKIYSNVKTAFWLGVINFPNALGLASNFVMPGFILKTPGYLGLPCMVLTSKKSFGNCIETLKPFIPNIITPNQDNLNDAFVLKNVDLTGFALQIFNRWGNLVYETKSYKNDWDAKENTAGIYYYLLRNSTTKQTYKGWLEVVK